MIDISDSLYPLLAVAGGAVGWFFRTWFGRADKREAELSRRENDYRERIDRQLEDINARFSKLERANTVLIGVVHVIIDDLEPESGTLDAITALLRDAYPSTEDTPADLLNLTARLDAKTKRRKRA